MARGFTNVGGGGVSLKSLVWTTAPTVDQCKGSPLDTTGGVITATYSDNSTQNVISLCTFSPTIFTTTGIVTVTASYTFGNKTLTCTTDVTVQAVKIVTWAGGTDSEIVAMVEAADNGDITLSDYWTVGDSRTVSLSAMAAIGVGESHVPQDVVLTLMNAGGKTLSSATASGRTTCSFVVGQKNLLSEYGYMNSTDTNTGGWSSSARRTWCNDVYKNAIPSTLLPIFKQFTNISGVGDGATSGLQTTTDYFALPAEKEIFGSRTYSQSDEAAALTQFTYYATSVNRIKYSGSNAYYWWQRSPCSGDSKTFCGVYADGSAGTPNASNARGLAPFGCI